jgi:hypothetical protein
LFTLVSILSVVLMFSVARTVPTWWAFSFQTLYLLLDSLGGGKNPAFRTGQFPVSYGLVTAGVLAAGFALVALGALVRARRATSRPGPLSEADVPA